MLRIPLLVTLAAGLLSVGVCSAAEYQWSVPMPNAGPEPTNRRVYLWIPPDCEKVRAVVVGQHNMLEEFIFSRPAFRKTMADLGFAVVWITPSFDPLFRFDQGAGERFEALMKSLADESGYSELAAAPVAPIGHSAHASYPWNFAAWKPERTLAVLSIKGDAPQTNLTGCGKPNVPWGDRKIDGVPGLMVIGEYEFGQNRVDPAIEFRKANPDALVCVMTDVGHGHFDASDQLIERLGMFLHKAADARLPDNDGALRPVDPRDGWLIDQWRIEGARKAVAAPYADYKGSRDKAFWCFDEEMARAIEADDKTRERKPQVVGYVHGGKPVERTKDTHFQVRLPFEPGDDGVTFRVDAGFEDVIAEGRPSEQTGLAPGTAIDHSTSGGPVLINGIAGPLKRRDDGIWQVDFHRGAPATSSGATMDLWFVASHDGADTHRSAVQQAMMKIPVKNDKGSAQTITFPEIPDQPVSTKSLKLEAASDAGLPVHYYVREGPAEVDGDKLVFLPIPPRAKYPVRVTVVAWQYGHGGENPVQTAAPVERSFDLVKGK